VRTSAVTARFGAIPKPLAYARGSVQSHDREGVVVGKGTKPTGRRPSPQTRAFLAAGLLALAAFAASAQEAAPEPQFEVASIKPSEGQPFNAIPGFARKCAIPDPVRFNCRRMSLWDLVRDAYGLRDYQLAGPAWMGTQLFDVTAKVPAGASQEQAHLMLRRLLADRFRMTIRREKREVTVYALGIGPNGHKLRESQDTGPQPPQEPPDPDLAMKAAQKRSDAFKAGGSPPLPPGGFSWGVRDGVFHLAASGQAVSRLVATLSDQLDHPVVDETGLTGKYDYVLEFASDKAPPVMMPGMGPLSAASSSELTPAPSVFKAVQSQLGLKLEPKKLPMETIVVDKAEKMPSEN